MFGWISWCNNLTYDQLLRGVPGTGTRKGGLQGSLLKVNLDGIVLLRYHGESTSVVLSRLSFSISVRQCFDCPL